MTGRQGLVLTLAFGAVSLVSVWAVAVPDVVRIPHRDLATPMPNARFSHRGHAQYQCYSCHPSVFPQMRESFTHVQMDEGRYCARCHNGGAAPAVKSYACEVCHAR
ncbi:MAG: cytochrome c3 family protein [Deltaproteobacteria bacterium]|nr:cytochrome c3 family protein [Deltaproteobacteria bacterium]